MSLARVPEKGSLSLPAAGAPLTSTLPTFPARRTPTWFFGDGAAMLNSALLELGTAAQLTPMDDAIATAGLGGGSGAGFGVRLRRRVSERARAELSMDVLMGSAALPGDLERAAEASSASFQEAFTALFASGPFTAVDVSARTDNAGGSSREIAVSGAINYDLAGGRFRPYITVGAGLIAGSGGGESLEIEGRYRATTVGGAPDIAIDETDRMTIRYARGRSYVGIGGIGVEQALGEGWGLNVDGRVFIGSNNARLQVSASPEAVRGTPPGFIETLTYPNLQFSNDPASGRESSLSGSLDDADVFKGSGIQTRVLITIGITKRF